MSLIPAPYLIFIGVIGLIYGLSFAFLLLSCGKLHRLEGLITWKVTWYCTLIGAILAGFSFAGMAFIFYTIISLASGDSDWIHNANMILSYGITLTETAGLTALIIALAYPLRKMATEQDEP